MNQTTVPTPAAQPIDHQAADQAGLGFVAIDPRAGREVSNRAELNLWRHVLMQAIEDARQSKQVHPEWMHHRSWVFSSEEGPGSFIWLVRLIGVDPKDARESVWRQMQVPVKTRGGE